MILEFDEELIVPDSTQPVLEAIVPFRRHGHAMNIWYKRIMRRFCRDFQVARRDAIFGTSG